MKDSPGPFLRGLARLLVRGPDASYILGDMEEAMQREIGRGTSRWRARLRFVVNALASGLSLTRSRRRTAGSVSIGAASERTTRFWNVSKLDVKLGVRMLLRYPGLSLVAVTGMAVAIAIAAGYASVVTVLVDAELPIPGGDRVVVLRNVNVATGRDEAASERDLFGWREAVSSVENIAAFRAEHRNLISADGETEVVAVAAITANGFALAGATPVLGRALLPADEEAGAPDVLVIGHDVWQRVFHGDADVVGHTVRLGDAVHTVIGVMPPDFGFPVRHEYWVPLRSEPGDQLRASAPLTVFGRLVEGVSRAHAQAELASIGRRMAAASPQTHEHLRPRVVHYTSALMGGGDPRSELLLRAVQLLFAVLLIIVAVNVAVLIYARTATRVGEIAVRSALGASRRRIVGQLFIEGAVLAGAATVAGLTLAHVLLGTVHEKLSQSTDRMLPFWVDFSLSPGQVVYVAALALLASAIVGVVPALKVTRQPLDAMKEAAARGSGGLQLGRTWTSLIVFQVAIAVAALPPALNHAGRMLHLGTRPPADAAHSLLLSTLESANDPAAAEELIRRLRTEPHVRNVTWAHRFPGTGGWSWLETDGVEFGAVSNGVGPDFFAVFDVPLIAGRVFRASDEVQGATAVIVNDVFAERLGGGSVLGRRVRYAALGVGSRASEWFEIVGVVPGFAEDFQVAGGPGERAAHIFHAVQPGSAPVLALIVRTDGNPVAFAPRLRNLAAAVDPAMHVLGLETVVEKWNRDRTPWWLFGVGIAAVMASVLMLSAAGIYAMMSFTVSRRRREIGIRAALGADARRVLAGIFRRAGAQLGGGIAAGLALALALETASPGLVLGGRGALVLPTVVTIILVVGLLAALGPARRAFSVQPTEVLRDSG